MADEDSEGALSRADSRADSHTDLQLPDTPDGTMHTSPMNTSKLSVSSEQEYDQPWVKGQGSASPQASPKLSPAAKVHQFAYKTFSVPYKCNYCTSILIGVHRQGIACRGKYVIMRKKLVSVSSYLVNMHSFPHGNLKIHASANGLPYITLQFDSYLSKA